MKAARILPRTVFADAPPAGGGKVALDPALAQRLLEELIYERVSTQVNLLELTMFERELDESIERVMADLAAAGDADAPGDVLASVLVDRAWHRVEDDRRALRVRAAEVDAACSPDEPFDPAPPRRGRAPRS